LEKVVFPFEIKNVDAWRPRRDASGEKGGKNSRKEKGNRREEGGLNFTLHQKKTNLKQGKGHSSLYDQSLGGELKEKEFKKLGIWGGEKKVRKRGVASQKNMGHTRKKNV